MWGLIRIIALPMLYFKQIMGLAKRGRKAAGKASAGRSGRRGRRRAGATLTVHGHEELDTLRRPADPDLEKVPEGEIPPWRVWDGRKVPIHLSNPGQAPRWFRIQVTDLPREEYEIYSEDFGAAEPADFIRLDPEDEVDFELAITGGAAGRTEPCTFYAVVTMFVRPSEDADHTVVRRNRYEWVPEPRVEDLSLVARPAAVLLRPWREQVELELEFTNASQFPMTPTLTVERQGLDGEALDDEPLQIDVPEPVPPNHRGRWDCVVSGGDEPGDPFEVRAVASAQVLRNEQQLWRFDRVEAPEPVEVDWAPFLTVWKDWLLVLGLVFGLVWLVWGVPVFWVRPILKVTLIFPSGETTRTPGQLPADVRPDDLEVRFQKVKAGTTIQPTKMEPVNRSGDRAEYIAVWPAKGLREKYYGFLWPWPKVWHPWSYMKFPFVLTAVSTAPAMQAYDLKALEETPEGDMVKRYLDIGRRPIFGREWITVLPIELPPKVRVDIRLTFKLSELVKQEDSIDIFPYVDNEEQKKLNATINQDTGEVDAIVVPLTDLIQEGERRDVEIRAITVPSGIEAKRIQIGQVERQAEAYERVVDFTGAENIGTLEIPIARPSAVPFRYEVLDANTLKPMTSGDCAGGTIRIPIEMAQPKQDILVKLESDEYQLDPAEQTVTLQVGGTAKYPEWWAIEKVEPAPEGSGLPPEGPVTGGEEGGGWEPLEGRPVTGE